MRAMTTEARTRPGFGAVFAAVNPDNPDFALLRKIVTQLIPFGTHAGVEVTELGPDPAVAEIPDEPHLGNHLRTVHAGALFLAADIAGACAFVGAVASNLSSIGSFVLRDSRITLNHHGNVPAFANNLRLYEATGVGTLLITDWKPDLHEVFEPGKEVVAYRSTGE